jgi:hypothetical protein
MKPDKVIKTFGASYYCVFYFRSIIMFIVCHVSAQIVLCQGLQLLSKELSFDF